MNPIVIYSLAYAGTAALQKGIGFGLFLWLAHSLSVQDYANFGLLFAMQVGTATLAGAGISESVVGLLKGHILPQARFQLFSAANLVFLLLSAVGVIVVATVYAMASWHTWGGVLELVFVVSGGLITAFFTLQATLVRLEERHLASLALSFLAPMTGLCAAFIAFSFGRNVGTFYAGMAGGLLLAFLVFRMAGVGHFSIALQLTETNAIRKTIGPYILIALLAWLGGYGNTYIVKFLFTGTDVARFIFVYTLSSVMHLVATSTNQVWSPRFFRLVHKLPMEEMERQNMHFYTLQGAALGVVGALVLLLLPVVIDALGGNLLAYRSMGFELFLLFSGYAVAIPWWHSQNYYLVHGYGKTLMNVVLTTSAIGLAAWLALMVLQGVIGIYVGFVVQMFIRTLGTLLWARRHWNIHVAWQGSLVALLLFAVGALAADAFFSSH